ncbi:MAG: acireductone synthase [Myxococcota bacterium]
MARITDVLLDIEGTTSSITFVHDVLFPYAREHLSSFVEENRQTPEVGAQLDAARAALLELGRPAETDDEVVAGLVGFIDEDRKDTALKALQGMIWASGYISGAYRAHLYPDTAPALERWGQSGLRVSIYSSGSVQAQKLFFGYSEAGDLSSRIHAHFDTTTGPKRAAESYRKIAEALERAPATILFASDVGAELDAAKSAGFHTVQLVRPGTEVASGHLHAADFDAVEQLFPLS